MTCNQYKLSDLCKSFGSCSLLDCSVTSIATSTLEFRTGAANEVDGAYLCISFHACMEINSEGRALTKRKQKCKDDDDDNNNNNNNIASDRRRHAMTPRVNYKIYLATYITQCHQENNESYLRDLFFLQAIFHKVNERVGFFFKVNKVSYCL
uniref:CSON012521 protein n=1 Tax=Culicoides sonorensis TaxID=179676 RepID=A0A336LI36_CULSO